MTQRLPPLGALRAFAAAGRHLSFQRAAAELAVTPTAISHQIRKLEDDIGVKLFRRLTRKLQLTEAGQTLLPEVAAAFDRLAGAVEHLRAKGDSGVLSISALQTLSFRWLAPRLPGFQALQPRIDVRLEASPRLVEFGREDVDVGIRHGFGNWPGLAETRLFEDRFTPLIAPSLLKRAMPLRRPEDVLRYPMLREDATNKDWEHWFVAVGVSPPANLRGPAFDSSEMAVKAALSGLGITVVNPDFFQEEIASGRLIQPFPTVATNGKSYFLVYPHAHAQRPKVAAFRDWLAAEAAAFVAARAERQPRRRKAAR